MSDLKYILALFLVFAGTGTGCAAPSGDAYLLHYYLDIKEERFYSKGSDGKPFYDELQAYKYREKTYLDLFQKSKRESAAGEDIKRFLFLGHAARVRNDAGIIEAFNSDLMSVYRTNRTEVLSALKQIPGLQASSCYYLGRYFGFEDRNVGGLDSFLESNGPVLKDILGPDSSQRCISTMKEVAR